MEAEAVVRDAIDDTDVLRAVLDASPDLVAIADVGGTILYVNPGGLVLIGLTELPQAQPLTIDELVVGGARSASRPPTGEWHGPAEVKNFATDLPTAVDATSFVVDRSPGAASVVVLMARHRRTAQDDQGSWRAAVTASRYRASEQQAVAKLSRLALDGELDQLLDAATAAASTLMGADRCMITRPIPGDVEKIAVVGFTGRPPRIVTAPAGHQSLMGYTLLTNEVVLCRDRDEETRFSTVAMASYGFRSGVGVPIPGIGSGPWGALSIHSNDNRSYGKRDLSFLQTVTGVLSAAIRRLDLDRQLHERSLRDPLTGLANRTYAYERVELALARAEVDGSLVAVLLLDIDDFKIINDSLGHEAGDRALVRVASRLAAAARSGDTVARVGGDEFLIVCEDVSGIEDAQHIAETLIEAISSPHPTGTEPTPLSTSIGIAVSTAESTRQELIHHADLAMYRAKDIGHGGSAVFDRDDLYDADRTRRLSVDLRAALGDGELNLLYQPIFDIATGGLVSMEALARWRHPDLGVIDPAEFVAVAERTGLVGDLGEWALRTACQQAASWRALGDVGIRVNVSALQLRDPAFVGRVAGVLASTGLPPTALGLEITETVLVSDTVRVAGVLTALHDMGIGLSLDDLGSGYSSIAYLNRYPVFDCFKIDKSYINDLPAARPTAIVNAIVMLARAFGLTVVGEGVETAEQLETLRQCGCDHAQGFLLGRPMTSAQAAVELAKHPRPRAGRS
jgi:diguanylate cyclase (GGDEF)-like protein